MADTYSTNLALIIQATGSNSGSWGTLTNTNIGTLIEQAISGYVTQAITDGADTTITIPNGATGVARNMYIEMTGALTAARNLIVPANKKLYFIYNNTTGGYAVTVKVSGQTGVSVPNGKKCLLVSNGTDIVEAVNQVVGNFAVGGTLGVTGAATLSGNVVLGDNSADTLRMTNDVFQNTGAKNLGFNTAPYGSWTSAAYSLEMGGPGYGIYTQSDTTRLMSNVVQESGGYKYARNDYAHLIALESGQFGVSLASSGTAGNAITFVTPFNVTLTGVNATKSLSVSTGGAAGAVIADFAGAGWGTTLFGCDTAGYNAAQTGMKIGRDSGTGRSINASGTVNASGADYAEYERKASDCGTVAKGQIIGFDERGEVTDLWARAKSFGVKSTDPSLVGGDTWGSESALGLVKPEPPQFSEMKPVEGEKEQDFDQRVRLAKVNFEADVAEHETAKERFAARLEAARQKVDRIAYSGKVPVNVLGAKVGDYIIPAQDGAGIKGVAVTTPTFDQYRIAVGQVRKILPDGRALIAVKVG